MSKILNWLDSDSQENYKPLNSGSANYGPDDISYVMNSHGRRCDDFDLPSELPIVFMGCSFTEGIGLPLEEVWAYHIHKKIVEVTGKNIPFWSLAKGGTSIDYAARTLYEYGPKLKPKYIFYLMSGVSRREYWLYAPTYNNWFPNPSKLYKPTHTFHTMNRVFADPFYALYQATRSAMIIDLVAKTIGAKVFLFGLAMDIVPDDQKTTLFKQFSNIEYVPVPDDIQDIADINIPDHIQTRPLFARDNSHPGARWQYKIQHLVWEHTKDKIKLEVL